MPNYALHHVSIVATDLQRAIDFYQDLFELERIERPPFASQGAWLACGDLALHIILNPAGTFRIGTVDSEDGHFAFRTDDFEGVMRRLTDRGFREDAEEDDPRHLLVKRKSVAGFPQVYLRDPDRNIVEVNGAR